jgi:tetratricopeptide (TPR) repeat protein
MLRLLVERHGTVIARDELRQALWPDGTHVDYDHGLNNAAARLRRALGDAAHTPRFLETLPRAGYRFIAPVSAVVAAEPPVLPAPARRWPAGGLVAAAVLVFAAGLGAGVLVTPRLPAAGSPDAIRVAAEARAQAERSLIHTRLVLDGDLPADLVYAAAHGAATRALTLDATLGDAHLAAGYAAMWGRWDWAAAGRLFDSALALDPASARAHQARALWLAARGRIDEARASIEQARSLDPQSPEITRDAATLAFAAGDTGAAVEHLRARLADDPDDARAHGQLAQALAALGRNRDAADHFRQFLVLIGISDDHARDDMHLLATQGMEGLIRRNLARPSNKPPDRYGLPFKLAADHAVVGEIDAALSWLDRAIAQRDSRLLLLAVNPRFAGLREDPRFQRLLARVGL